MTKLEDNKDVKKPAKKKVAEHVYEPSEVQPEHNPYETKVGGKPPATLADGTVPNVVNATANKA